MPRKIIYRKQLLQAVEAFLDKTPSSLAQAHHIIQHYSAAICSESRKLTLDQVIWGGFIRALTDSVCYESEEFLQETREILLGHSSQATRAVFKDDYCVYFTTDEAEWHAQLLSLLDFIVAIPFAKIHAATVQAWQNQITWPMVRETIPEAIQAEEIEEEYQRRKILINTIAARSPAPENIGDEKIYHIVLREVTALITGINVGKAAVYCGYPMLDSPYVGYGNATVLAPGIRTYSVDMSESLQWARRALEALEGKGALIFSWSLSKAPTFNTDVLLISIH